MKDFGIEDFARHLSGLAVQCVAGTVLNDIMLEYIGKTVEKAAKDKIGEYQGQAGQFVAWAELAESTKQQREAQGYPEDEPLLRTGGLRDSIEHSVGFQEVSIGSNNPIAEYQELGTEHIPPRSFLGGAAYEKTPQIIERLGVTMQAFLVGENVFQGKMKIE